MNRIKVFFCKLQRVLDTRPLLFLTVLSISQNCVLELLGRRSLISFLKHMAVAPHIFLFNSTIILCSFTIVLLVKRRAFGVLMISSFWLICGIANAALMTFRASPFTARDILLVGYGIRVADIYLSKPLLVLIAAGISAFAAGAVLAFIKLPKRVVKSGLARLPGLIIPAAVTLVLAANASAGFIESASDYDSILDAYNDYGFAYCFTNSMLSFGVDRPESYSAESLNAVSARLRKRTAPPTRRPNIVFVQLESFFDPSALFGLVFDENPIPVFTALKTNGSSGKLNVPSLGGGTANTEFEILTGMTLNHFGMGEYPFESILRERGCESIAFNLKKLNYKAHAIHNHSGSFYSRNTVYSMLGFDRFVSLEYMRNMKYTQTGWAKDEALTKYITDCLKSSNGPDFVFTVTVQGHGKYPSDFDNTPFGVEEHNILDQLDVGAFEYFLAQLNETDAFIGELIAALDRLEEDSILVLYGDHLPPMPVSAELLEHGSLYTTEYVIWNNFGLAPPNKNVEAYELSAYVLGLLGIDEGIITRLHQTIPDDEGKDELLALLEYDMLYGERYADGAGAYIPTKLQMGLMPITLESARTDGACSYVSGENFTPFSVIYINGQRTETVFITDSLLRTPDILKSGDIVEVCQTGPDRYVLSSTNKFLYR